MVTELYLCFIKTKKRFNIHQQQCFHKAYDNKRPVLPVYMM